MTYDQIRQKIYLLTKRNINSLPNADLNLYTQPAEDRTNSLILRADSKWQFDDSNYLDLPIATTTVTSGQADYSLATTHLTIDRVEILKTSGGTFRRLIQIDQQLLKRGRSMALDEYQSGNGTPSEYDLVSNSVVLYPTPDYTLAAALKLHFTRGFLKFDFTDDKFTDNTGSSSSTPGFNLMFHELIPLRASLQIGIPDRGLRREVRTDLLALEAGLDEFFGSRNRDARAGFSVSTTAGLGNVSGRLNSVRSDSNR